MQGHPQVPAKIDQCGQDVAECRTQWLTRNYLNLFMLTGQVTKAPRVQARNIFALLLEETLPFAENLLWHDFFGEWDQNSPEDSLRILLIFKTLDMKSCWWTPDHVRCAKDHYCSGTGSFSVVPAILSWRSAPIDRPGGTAEGVLCSIEDSLEGSKCLALYQLFDICHDFFYRGLTVTGICWELGFINLINI